MMTNRFSLLLIGLLLNLFSIWAYASPLQVQLSDGPSTDSVRVELTNTGRETLQVLRWNTPFGPVLSHDVFQVSKSARALALFTSARFVGRHVKRGVPTQENYLTLHPGESVTADINLADYYAVQYGGQQSVRLAGEFLFTPVSTTERSARQDKKHDELLQLAVVSNVMQVQLAPTPQSRARIPAYNGCSAEQQSYIQSANEQAEILTNAALAGLESLTPVQRSSSPRYTTWFGSYSEARFDRVVSNFQSISTALADETIRYDCSCNEAGVYAYVYAVRPYDIFLCPVFHEAPETGTNSRAGTIIHELSHFTVLAGTDDHVYSQQAAQNLAVNAPATAIDNADNHEYFAENTPALAISPSNDSPQPTTSTTLTINDVQNGSVSEGEAQNYQASNAESIILTSISGDADLYIYSDDARTQLICQSIDVTQTDQCNLFTDGEVFITVSGYSSADYAIEATGQSTTSPQAVTPLLVGSTVSASVAKEERDRYEVSNADTVELVSITGDADLYIFSGSDFDDTSLVCTSRLSPDDNRTDTCSLPDASSTHYVMVVGWSDSNYELTARETAVDTTPELVTTSFGVLALNQEVQREVEERGLHVYDASGVSSVELTSLTGDADLVVFDGLIDDGGTILCVSEEFTTTSALDSCDVSGSIGADLQIAVFGYSASRYTLIGRGPSNDAGTPPVTQEDNTPENPLTQEPVNDGSPPGGIGGGASGDSDGGSAGLYWILTGLLVAGLRRWRRVSPC